MSRPFPATGSTIFPHAVQTYVESNGYSLVREYTGHGMGAHIHEDPEVPNYVPESGRNERLVPKNMVICVEPMVNAGTADIRNKWIHGWVVMTADHKHAGTLRKHHSHHRSRAGDSDPLRRGLIWHIPKAKSFSP